jgi:hypothetical protein
MLMLPARVVTLAAAASAGPLFPVASNYPRGMAAPGGPTCLGGTDRHRPTHPRQFGAVAGRYQKAKVAVAPGARCDWPMRVGMSNGSRIVLAAPRACTPRLRSASSETFLTESDDADTIRENS